MGVSPEISPGKTQFFARVSMQPRLHETVHSHNAAACSIARAALFPLCVAACGPVRLGDEPSRDVQDAPALSDASAPALPSVRVSVRAPERCDGCFELLAEASGGLPPYSIEWEDGSHEALRRVCSRDLSSQVSVTVSDANAAHSVPHTTRLEPSDAGCPQEAAVPPVPLLCLDNGSFEGTPAVNSVLVPAFDASPWEACINPSQTNTPDVVSASIQQFVATLPAPTEGATYLGLFEGEQVSQRLCRGVSGGSVLSFSIDLRRLNVTAGLVADTERAFLEVWGGTSADCSARELLWASSALELITWQPFCVTLRPQQFMDQLTLRARSDETQLSSVYLLADNLVPVGACPAP